MRVWIISLLLPLAAAFHFLHRSSHTAGTGSAISNDRRAAKFTALQSTVEDKEPAVVEKVDNLFERKQFLQTMMSSRSNEEVKQQLVQFLQEKRMKDPPKLTAFLNSILEEINSVEGNKWALKRWRFPLPSYRVKLATMRRLIAYLVEEEIAAGMNTNNDNEKDESLKQRLDNNTATEQDRARRALYLLLSQLKTVPGVYRLEREAMAKQRQSTRNQLTMKDMLARTPSGLETPKYSVLSRSKASWEVRKYDEFSVCSTFMGDSQQQQQQQQGTKTGAPGQAFNALAGYIFGGNQEQQRMAMTTPVISTAARDKMSFVMPSDYWGDSDKLTAAPTPMAGANVLLETGGGGLLTGSAGTGTDTGTGTGTASISTVETTPSPTALTSSLSSPAVNAEAEDATSATSATSVSEPATDSDSAVAVMWFGGYATRSISVEKASLLRKYLKSDPDWMIAGDGNGTKKEEEDYFLMQYNDPFQPPWKRRNEVAIPVVRRAK